MSRTSRGRIDPNQGMTLMRSAAAVANMVGMDELEPPAFKREGIAPGPIYELHLDRNQVLTLADRTVEFLKADQPAAHGSWRWHVRHVAVKAKPRRDGGIRLGIGLARDGDVWTQATVEVPPGKVEDVNRFFEIAKREAER